MAEVAAGEGGGLGAHGAPLVEAAAMDPSNAAPAVARTDEMIRSVDVPAGSLALLAEPALGGHPIVRLVGADGADPRLHPVVVISQS